MRTLISSPTRSLPRRSRASRARRVSLERLEGRELLAAVAPPGGLISWWTADNTAADLKGLNNASLVSGATYAVGMVGQAFSLDGVNDRVQMADSNSLKLTQSLTIEGWIKVDSLPPSSTHSEILFRGDDRGGLDPYSIGVSPQGGLNFSISSLTGGVTVGTPIVLGQWLHVAATLDDATGAMKLHINGELAAQTVTTVRPFGDLDPASNPGVGIGNHGGYPTTPHNFPFDGLIDELAIYNRALTQAEIRTILAAGGDGKVRSANHIATDFPSVTEGASTLTFTLTRVGSTSGQVVVNWATADGTATAGADYVASSGQVVFENGETVKTVVVTLLGDTTPEATETFWLTLSTPTSGWGAGSGLATITNDDVGVSVGDVTVLEDVSGYGSRGALVDQSANGGLNRSTGMAWGPDGNLYVGSLNSDAVLRFDGTTGEFLGTFISPGSGLDSPAVKGLHFHTDGKVYVLSRDQAEVRRYDATTGAFLDVFITSGSGGLAGAAGMTAGPDGNWYVASQTTNQILRYSGSTGAFLGAFVSAGSGGLNGPRSLTFGPDGNLYVSNSAGGAGTTVLRYNGQTGAFMNTFVTGSGGLLNPADLLFSNGNLFVASQNTNEVLRYDAATGAFLDKAVTAGLDGLDRPVGLLLDPNGNLLVGGSAEINRYAPGATAVFTVQLNIPSATPVTVEYTTANGTATDGSDYTTVSGTVTFAPGQTVKSVAVPILDDAGFEANETFTVTLSNAVGASITDDTGVGTITDDESTRVFTVSDTTAVEGGAPHFIDAFASAGIAGAQFNTLTFGPDGDLYVAIGGSAGSLTNSVLRYDGNTGVYKGVFASQAYLNTTRDLIFRNGKLYVADLDADAVKIFDASTGAYLGVFASHSSLVGPEGIVFGPDGNMYVTGWRSNNVVRFNGTTGAYMNTFITGLSAPTGIEFINGNFFVTNQTNQVRRYSATGAYLASIGSSADGLSNPLDIAVGPSDGLLYVTSGSTSRILRYNLTSNAYVDDFVPAGTGGLSYSRSLTFHNGDFYVTSIENDDVLRYGSASEAVFTVTLSLASSQPVTVQYATADATAIAGTDYTATSSTLTFAPGQTTRVVRVPVLNDAVAENTEAFTLVLSNPVGATLTDGTGVGTVTDDDTTKFFVVNDGSPDRTYEYNAAGGAVENYTVDGGNTAPRGAASTAAGDKVWVVDANKKVYVYNTSGGLLGSWTAGSLASNATAEGIATNGTDIWIVDARQDKVFKYTGAATRLSGSQNAASSFALNGSNTSPKDVVTDGTNLWVVNDSTTDMVFKYTLSGSLAGSWTITGAGSSPTGVTLDPSGGGTLWVVDSGTDRVYQFDNARSRTTGSQSPSTSFALAAGNTNPQGIADPPVPTPGASRATAFTPTLHPLPQLAAQLGKTTSGLSASKSSGSLRSAKPATFTIPGLREPSILIHWTPSTDLDLTFLATERLLTGAKRSRTAPRV